MELQIESVKSAADGRLDAVRSIYDTSFPVEEQRPWDALLAQVGDGGLALYVAMADGAVAGMATVWHLDGFLYIEHLAVDERWRGHGLGAQMVRRLLGAESSPVVLEVEPAGVSAMAERRIGFYERLGFTAHHGYCYMQPPYGPGLPPVALTLMTAGEWEPDLAAVTASLHSRVYGVR